MKTMRNDNILRILILILSLCFSYRSYAGGVHIGGGNSINRQPVSAVKIRQQIEYYHHYRNELLTSLKIVGLSARRVLAIQDQLKTPLEKSEKTKLKFQAQLYETLFINGNLKKGLEKLSKQPQQKTLDSLVLRFEETGACLDNLGIEYDASVVNIELHKICFSLKRLTEKLGSDNYEVELLALYLHELTHCFGSSEEEATALQEDIRQLGSKYKEYLPFLDPSKAKEPNLKSQLSGILAQVELIEPNFSDSPTLCLSLSEISKKIFFLFQSQSGLSTGQSVLGFKGVIAFHAAFVVSAYLNDFCDPLQGYRRQIKFKEEKQNVLLSDLYPDPTMILFPLGPDMSLKLSAYLFADLSDATLTAPSYQEKASLTSNLAELRRLLTLSLKSSNRY